MTTTFGKIPLGQHFVTRDGVYLKVHKTTIRPKAVRNAILLLGRQFRPATALGAMFFFEDDTEVVLVPVKTGKEWADEAGQKILDPDGWRSAGIGFVDTPIDKPTYERLRNMSTIAA